MNEAAEFWASMKLDTRVYCVDCHTPVSLTEYPHCDDCRIGLPAILAAIDADDKLSDDAKAAMRDLVTVVYKQLTEGCDEHK